MRTAARPIEKPVGSSSHTTFANKSTGAASQTGRNFSFCAEIRDLQGRGEVQRRLYELDAVVRGGNSGGPFVLPDGRVAGVVFANSVIDDEVGYAIAASQIRPVVAASLDLSAPTGVGACAI